MVDGPQSREPTFQPAPTGEFTPAPTVGQGGPLGSPVITIRGGGGQTTITQDRAAAKKAAEARRQSELREIAAEQKARETAFRREEARQERIEAGRISGQLEAETGEGFEGIVASVELQREAERRGRGFTGPEASAFFRERGTSIAELREERASFIGTGALRGAISASFDVPTITEQTLRQSLPEGISARAPEEVLRGQTLLAGQSIQPTLESRIIGRDLGVPTSQVFFLGRGGRERPATFEETEFFREARESELVISPEGRTARQRFLSPITGGVSAFNLQLRESLTEPIGRGVGIGFGALGGPTSLREAKRNIGDSSEFLIARGVPRGRVKLAEGIAGAGVGIAQDVLEKPLKQIITFGAGGVLGAGLGILGRGAARVGPRISKGVRRAEIIGGLGFGGFAIAETTGRVISAPTAFEKGAEIGISLKDLGLIGAGAIKGERALERSLRRFSVIGRQEVPFESLTVQEPFAEAPRGTTGADLVKQFRKQQIITAGGERRIIGLPGEEQIPGIKVFTASASGPRGGEFAAFLGKSREPGPFFSPQLSKEFLGKDVGVSQFFSLTGRRPTKRPIAFRTVFEDVTQLPKGLLGPRVEEVGIGKIRGFKGFATPAEQRIVSFRATKQDPSTAIISTRFELFGGEIEAIGRPGAVFGRIPEAPKLFTRTPAGQIVPIEFVRPTGRVVRPADLGTRIRPTAIIRTKKGIVTTFAPEEEAFILPGGGLDPGESLLKGLGREVFEETGLRITSAKQIGEITGPIKRFGARRPSFRFVEETFPIFEAEAVGVARPRGEIKELGFITKDSQLKVSDITKQILDIAGEPVGRPRVRKGKKPKREELSPGEITSEQLSELSRVPTTGRSSLITPSRIGAREFFDFGRGRGRGIRGGGLVFGDVGPRSFDLAPFSLFASSREVIGGGILTEPPPIKPLETPEILQNIFEEPRRRRRLPKSDEGKRLKERKRSIKRRTRQISPSLTGIGFAQLGDIFGDLPTGRGVLGVTPGQIRFVPQSPRRKPKKKSTTKKKKK